MQSISISSVRRSFTSEHFTNHFQNLQIRYSELCIDENNRQILQIDFNVKEIIPALQIASYGLGITNYLQDKGYAIIFNSCTSNGINRLYYRAFVIASQSISDPEVSQKSARKQVETKLRSDSIAQSPTKITAPKRIEPKPQSSVAEKCLMSARKPGDRSGLGFVSGGLLSDELTKADATEICQPSTADVVLKTPVIGKVADPELSVKFDKLNLKAYGLEQEVTNLKEKLVDKELEMKAIIDEKRESCRLKFSSYPRHTIELVRQSVMKKRIPLREKEFLNYYASYEGEDVMLETYYNCEFLGLRDSALTALMILIEHMQIPNKGKDAAILAYALLIPHIRFLMKRDDELSCGSR